MIRDDEDQDEGTAGLAHARITAKLRRDLMCGHYAPGQVMTLRKLAAQFNTSPMPVRDALRQLVTERALVVINANRSVAVPSLNVERLNDIYRVRRALEGMAVELAAEKATPKQIAEMGHILAVKAATGPGPNIPLNREFHFAIYTASESRVLVPIIESLWLQFGPYLRWAAELIGTSEDPGDPHHSEILAAIAAHDPARARRAMMNDIATAVAILLDNFNKPHPQVPRAFLT